MINKEKESDAIRTSALRELLTERRVGKFLTEEKSDAQIDAMLSDKRAAHGL